MTNLKAVAVDYLPLFVDLKHRPVLVVGGGDVAARKIALLQRACADVRIVAQTLTTELQQQSEQNRLSWLGQCFDPVQLKGIYLVIAATDDQQLNARISQAADQHRIFVNVVDDRPHCSFIFPSIIDRSPLMVAVSSGGEAPVLARLWREKLEAILPASLGKMAQLAGRWRVRVKQRFDSIIARRRFWESAFSGHFASLVSAGRHDEAEQQLSAMLANGHFQGGGVTLVGAGPGDAGLLTLKGLQAIQQADVVLYDHLVSDEVLELTRRDADKICVGKRTGSHSIAQAEINRLLLTLAQQGKRVVRLKGGDPFIFGRGGEELAVLAEAGIPFQVVPGITAAVGATAYAGIPLTHRDHSQSVLFVTGHCRPAADALDWAMLARSRQTLAIYMGTIKAKEIKNQLLAHGCSAQTPVAVIGRGTRGDQQVLLGTLARLDELAVQAPPPVLLVIGEVVTLHHQLAWFGQPASVEAWSSGAI